VKPPDGGYWPSLERIKAAADVARDWAALLYTPVLTLYAVWVTAVIVWAYPWAEKTQAQRLDFLGAALIVALCLIGLGTLFYQRQPPPRIRAKSPAGELEIGGEAAPPEGAAKPRPGPLSAPQDTPGSKP
jgi:hypothetical protein